MDTVRATPAASRSTLVLAGALALQILLILLLRAPWSSGAGASTSHALAPELEAITPVRLELGGAGAESITLEKTAEGWGVAGLAGFPADGAKVEKLISDLKTLQVRRPVVKSSRYHEAFKVEDDDHEGRIRLWADASAEPKLDLIVGDSPNYRVVHLRLAGQDPVYEARGLAAYDVQPQTMNWIKKELVDAPADKVIGLEVVNANGVFRLDKAEGTWKVTSPEAAAGSALDAQKVEDLVRTATSLRLADAVGAREDAAQGFAQPAATITLRWTTDDAGGTAEASVEVGGPVPDKSEQRYLGRKGLAYTGTIWDSSVTPLLEKKLDDLRAS